MGKSLEVRYLDYLKFSKAHIEELKNSPTLYKDLIRYSFCQSKEERIFHFKKPHSRAFKLIAPKLKSGTTLDEFIKKDNEIATANELLFQNIYRKYNIRTAEHLATDLTSPNYTHTDTLGVISENFIGKDLEYTTLYDFFCMHEDVNCYKNIVDEKYYTFYKRKVGSLELYSQVLSILGGINNLEQLLNFRETYQELLTPATFDKTVIDKIISVFNFSDDDHLTNGYYIKKKNQEYFEDYYIFDKESTSFTFPIAIGNNYKSVKKATLGNTEYNGHINIFRPKENFEIRKQEIIKLIRNGKLEPKFCEVLKDIANLHYDKLASFIKQEYNVEANPIQLDMLKFGSEQAGIALEKGLE